MENKTQNNRKLFIIHKPKSFVQGTLDSVNAVTPIPIDNKIITKQKQKIRENNLKKIQMMNYSN